jgi:hypothetical protein
MKIQQNDDEIVIYDERFTYVIARDKVLMLCYDLLSRELKVTLIYGEEEFFKIDEEFTILFKIIKE